MLNAVADGEQPYLDGGHQSCSLGMFDSRAIAGLESLFVVKMPKEKGRSVVVAGLDSLKRWELGDKII